MGSNTATAARPGATKYGRALTGAEKTRNYRAGKRGAKLGEQIAMEGVEALLPEPPADPADALIQWAADKLIVPPGHPLEGQPMVLPPYLDAFIRETFTVRESCLTLARKQGKTAGIAILVLGFMAGPLRRMGWRAAVVSLNKEKGYELVRQMREIAAASRLGGLRFLRSPAPGRVEAGHGATLDVLAADAAAGAASGYDLVIVDELGLLVEKDRALLSGLKSSLSARRGRFVAISIRGDGPFVNEYLDRAEDESVCVHAYMPAPGSDPCDPATWAAGNPGLECGIKDYSYMVDRARAVTNNPADMGFFAAEDCNLPGRAGVELVCPVGDWRALCESEPPPRRGACVIGFDAGGSSSLTAAVVCWINGRMEVYAAAPVSDDFDLADRGRFDAVGGQYVALHSAGELWTYEGRRTTPAAAFLADVRREIGDSKVVMFGADRYRQSEVTDYMTEAKVAWPVVWRGTGAGKTADGSADLRAFQKGVLDGWLRPARGAALMVAAIEQSEVRRDASGNPALSKSRQRSRIDALQAGIIAAGLALPMRNRPQRRRNRVSLLSA